MREGPRSRRASRPARRWVVPRPVRTVLLSVGFAVAMTLALTFFGVPTATEQAGDEEGAATDPALSVTPMCRDVHGADVVGMDQGPASDEGGGMQDVRAWATAEAPDVFAGTWNDTVAFTEDTEALTEEVHARFGDDIEVVEVDHTVDGLEAVRRAADAEMADQRDGDADDEPPRPGDLTDVTILLEANRVRLTVADLDNERAAELTERHGATHICLVDEPIPDDAEASAHVPAPEDPR